MYSYFVYFTLFYTYSARIIDIASPAGRCLEIVNESCLICIQVDFGVGGFLTARKPKDLEFTIQLTFNDGRQAAIGNMFEVCPLSISITDRKSVV